MLDQAKVSKRIEALMATAVVPGLSLAVVEDGQIIWAQGFGVADVYSGEPIGLGTTG